MDPALDTTTARDGKEVAMLVHTCYPQQMRRRRSRRRCQKKSIQGNTTPTLWRKPALVLQEAVVASEDEGGVTVMDTDTAQTGVEEVGVKAEAGDRSQSPL